MAETGEGKSAEKAEQPTEAGAEKNEGKGLKEEEEMAKPKKAADPTELPLDEYTPLVDDFAQVVERGVDSYQEKEVPGRKLTYVGLGMESRTVLICRTNEQGIPELIVTGTHTDNRGRTRRERRYIGARAEAATKGRGEKSANLVGRTDTTVKEFEVGKQAYGLVESAIKTAQDKGENVQRKIDEEDFVYFEPLAREGQKTFVNCDIEPEIDLNLVRELVATAWQEVKRRLGSKAKEIEIALLKWTENFIYADTEGARVSYVIPRISFTVSVKTKKSEAFGCLRGACGTLEQILTRNDAYQGMTPLEAVKTLAAEVAKEAVDLDRAQSVSAVGSEFYVLFGSQVAGVLAHEVYGHTSEGDIIAANRWEKDAAVNLKSRLGGSVSSNRAVRLIETGSDEADLGDGRVIRHGFGSIVVDGRGDPAKEVTLIENGTQVGALTDRYCFGEITDGIPTDVLRRMKEVGLTGSARREKYDEPLLVRMRNTFFCPNPNGPKSPEEAAALIPRNKKGIYLVSCEGGWVDPDGGDFAILGKLGYLIENGQITDKPLKEIMVKGNITSFGDQVVAVGSGETMTLTFPGYCGKDGQTVPVDGAGPILLVKDVKAATFRRRPWCDLVREYQRQHKEVAEGKRRKSDIFFPAIAEELPEEDKRPHQNICVVTIRFSDTGEEVAYVLGLKEHADFEVCDEQDDGGVRRLKERRNPYD